MHTEVLTYFSDDSKSTYSHTRENSCLLQKRIDDVEIEAAV